MNYDDNNAIAKARDGQVVIVGEDHTSNDLYRELARDVIADTEPRAAAIEARRPRSSRRCAMAEIQNFARQANVPLFAVDTSIHTNWPSNVDTTGLYDIINDTGVNNDDGSYDPAFLGGARGGTVAKYGQEAADAVWADREHDMAARLHHLIDEGAPTPIIMGCGCYHVKALKERLDDPDHDRLKVGPERHDLPEPKVA